MELSQNDIHDNIIHFITNEGNDNVEHASYNKEEDVWMVSVKKDYERYMFMGKISPEGIPLEGSIFHNDVLIMFHNNKELFNNNFKDTIIYLWRDERNKTAGQINNDNNNEYYQTYDDGYEYTCHKEVDEWQEKKNKVFKKYSSTKKQSKIKSKRKYLKKLTQLIQSKIIKNSDYQKK